MRSPLCKVNELESPLLFRYAQELGWSGWTEVLVSADHSTDSIRITRRKPICFLCGSYTGPLYSLQGHQICDDCAEALLALRAANHKRIGEHPPAREV